MSLDPAAIAASQNLHYYGVAYGDLPATTLEPNGYDESGQPFWRFGIASNPPIYGVVDLPNGGHGGISAGGIAWSNTTGVPQYQEPVDVSLMAFDIDPYATPTPLAAGSDIFHGSEADGRIFGTGTGSTAGPTPSVATAASVAAGQPTSIPWGLIIIAAIVVILISNDR